MKPLKKPGVYIEEKNAFPSSVVEVPSAVSAFIGYTAKRPKGLDCQPWRITSFSEFEQFFGGPPPRLFRLRREADGYNKSEQAAVADKSDKNELIGEINGYSLSRVGPAYLFYSAIQLFYQNGGGTCYIVSIGGYSDEEPIRAASFISGLETLKQEAEPTLVLVPDAVSLDTAEAFYSVCREAITHCGQMRNRMAILDVYQRHQSIRNPGSGKSVVERFREAVGNVSLDYAAAYYPWLETTIVEESSLSFQNLTDDSLDPLVEMISAELSLTIHPENEIEDEAQRKKRILFLVKQLPEYTVDAVNNWTGNPENAGRTSPAAMNQTLLAISQDYKALILYLQKYLNRLPPAAAMAGLYNGVDSTGGVWTAPANLSMFSVIAPSVTISTEEQEYLSTPLDGKAVNAIRSFKSEGVLVWGARTLDGNSKDWRYIHVRRTMMVLEQSMRLAIKAYTFEPNIAATWTTVKSMLVNYLTTHWKMGALNGASLADAFSVGVGVGESMTAEDISNGIMRVRVLVAINRPAEFIAINIEQHMQKI